MPGWVLHLWNEWSIQILILLSFTLQVFILIFAGMRRRNSLAWRLLLWLAYLLAETTALYTLGHISNSKLPELGPAAFWVQFLLLHLGGKDTMTAYALEVEDNQLWLRHLLTLVLQSLGAAYLFYRHIADGGTLLVMAAVLIYLVGFMKYGERVWTLKSSSRDGITNFLDNLKLDQSPEGPFHNDGAYGAEDVLRDAHNLLYISLLMHDIFYTKAVVIHTWYGCCTRALSLVATVTALLLFRLKTGKGGYTRADVAFTYTLLVGAIVLEMASILRAIGSSWTCAICIDKIKNPGLSSTWEFARRNGILDTDGLHSALKFLRRTLKSAERGRKWPGSVGQHNLLGLLFTMKQDLSSRIATSVGFDRWLYKRRITFTVDIHDLHEKVLEETLKEIERMVKACRGNEDMLRSYRGQCALRGWEGYSEDLTGWCIDIDFDESILAWHLATNFFLSARVWDPTVGDPNLMYAIRVLSNYMMFLLVEHPYMLPSHVRTRQYDLAYSWLLTVARTDGPFVSTSSMIDHDKVKLVLERVQQGQSGSPAALVRGATLATTLLGLSNDGPEEHLLRVIFGVWVEMLCYAASHCSRDSHARQLNSGPEFITVVWILQATMFNYINGDTAWVRRATDDFFQSQNQPAQQ
ncbi:hypothetical protein ACQ4PT_000629 [Festuca glaucescens]